MLCFGIWQDSVSTMLVVLDAAHPLTSVSIVRVKYTDIDYDVRPCTERRYPDPSFMIITI